VVGYLNPRVMCGVAAAATHALLSSSMMVADCFQPVTSRMYRLAMISDLRVWLTALISDSAVLVDTLP
jgi:hypothetical protein